MAKLNRFIVEMAEVFRGIKIDFDSLKPPKYLVQKFVKIIKLEVRDPRYEKMCSYPLETILVVTFLAVLSDCKTWGEIADFGRDYKKWLSKFVVVGDFMPIDDTYRRVIGLIDSNELSQATIKYVVSIFKRIKIAIEKKEDKLEANYKLINIDGKEARGTGRLYNTPDKIPNLHTLNVYDSSDGVSLFSIPIPDKTNEIPEAQKVLQCLNLKNVIITMDALHCQHKTLDIIMKKRGDYLIGIKANQANLFEEISLNLTEDYLKKLEQNSTTNLQYIKTDDYHEYYKIPASHFAIDKTPLDDKTERWSGFRNLICYRLTKKKTGEVVYRYFVTSLNDLNLSVEAIVGRWDIENLLHRHLDMDFGEDDNKTMDVNAYTNLSIINKLSLSILKMAKPILENRSMRRIKKSMSRDISSYLSIIMSVVDPENIEKILEAKAQEQKNNK